MKTVVCLGDSITRGRVGVNYVKLLGEELRDSFRFINKGVNGDLSYNILQRVESTISLNPDFVILLIGTNDVWATQSADVAKDYIKKKGLKEYPSREGYSENLRRILTKLIEGAGIRTAVMSLPLISEDKKNALFLRTIDYSRIIESIAGHAGAHYLDLNERQQEYLEGAGSSPSINREVSWDFTGRMIFEHYTLMKSWDRLSKTNGFQLTVDLVHQNSTGAGIIKDCVLEFLRNQG